MTPRFFGLLAMFALVAACASQEAVHDLQDPEDGTEWPKEIASAGTKIVVYQPQVESLKGDRLSARSAVSVQGPQATAPVFGAIWMEAHVLTDRDRRTVTPIEVQVTEVRFPQADRSEVDHLRRCVADELPKWSMTFSLDHLLSELALIDRERAKAQGLRNDVPRIVYRSHPTVLLAIDGAPHWRDLPGQSYRRLANSAFFVIQDTSSSVCYLHIPPYWWSADGPLAPWQNLENAPAGAVALWTSEPKPDLPAADPQQPAPERPEVVVSTEPAELVWTQGPSNFAPIGGTDLLYVRNTESDLFLEIQSQTYYVLLSGRWYKGAGGKGPWTYVPADALPLDFSRIPLGSEKQHVLASVAGTRQARDAVLDAQIPQTAAVQRGPAPDLNVTYDGAPQLGEIEGSQVQHAVNTPYAVFFTDNRYYCCNDGVWYDSGLAEGPWDVCGQVPEEIYLVPPTCPNYYCTYCHVFGCTPGVVYAGYYPGYRGCYISGPTVVYGTGWTYPAWSGSVWYPRPVTWGVGVQYDFYSGSWNCGLGVGGPYAWMGLRYAPEWRGHSVCAGVGGWWGGVGYRHPQFDVRRNLSFREHYEGRTVHNIYARHPERLAPIHRQLPSRVRTLPAEGRGLNNIYADRRGNPYRQPPEGGWERRTSQGWERETPVASHEMPQLQPHHWELERRSQSRSWGQQRAAAFHQSVSARSYGSPRGRR